MKTTIALTVMILALATTQSHARPGDPFTQYGCGRNTVAAGDPADKVLQYCGQPTSIQTKEAANTAAYKTGRNSYMANTATHVIETWTYNFGPRGGMVQMNFRDGVLRSITDKGAGY